MTFRLYSLSLLLLAIGCATPAPISKLNPVESSNYFWQNGRQVVSLQKDSLIVELAFRNSSHDLFIFDLTIVNEQSKPVIVDPFEFSYKPVTASGDTLTIVYAENPEERILNEEIRISKLDAERSNQLISTLFWGTIDLADEVVNGPEPYDYDAVDYHRDQIREIDFNQLTAVEQKDYWENQTIRKTTLFSEHYITGQILLKRLQKIKQLEISLPIGDEVFLFTFDHLLISAR